MLCRFGAAGREALLAGITSTSRESLILLHPRLHPVLQAFVYPDHGAHIQASVVNWNKICFLSRSSDVRKEHVQLQLRADWGAARAAQEPSGLPLSVQCDGSQISYPPL